ncbi:MAG: dTDP-4-dehydrorhamnose reductase [Candidatus Parcubacteria bacterium]|nr:dTDP-4-dehydrorhamnose reductase [Candidatus Parcubacteria bacterium]
MDKKSKILILGAKGMLGQDLAKVLVDFDLTLWDKTEIDIADEYQVKTKITALNPQIIINCAAYTAVDDCETNQELALRVNNQAVGYLALVAQKLGAIILHISTDYVFNGKNEKGYAEDSQEFGPVNFYGESKLLGEKSLMNIAEKYYLIRTSWLYGNNGKNFVETMLNLGKEKNELKVVADQFGKPTYTVDLAKQILYILNSNLPFGIYHVTNETKEGGISWLEFAQEIFELAKSDAKVTACTSQEFSRPAVRPVYSALINTKLPRVRDWAEALNEYLDLRYKI